MQADSTWAKMVGRGGGMLRKGKIHMYVWWRCSSKPQSHFFNCTRSDTSMNAWHLLAAHLFPRDSKKCFFLQFFFSQKTGSMCNSKRVKSVCDTFFVVFLVFFFISNQVQKYAVSKHSPWIRIWSIQKEIQNRTHTHTHRHIHTLLKSFAYSIHLQIHTYTYVCMCVCMCRWMYVCKKINK